LYNKELNFFALLKPVDLELVWLMKRN
jgi:hypothetical protein